VTPALDISEILAIIYCSPQLFNALLDGEFAEEETFWRIYSK
jgi:hypothetical protein